MTPKDAYASRGQNPMTGVWVNEWHAYGSVFTPQGIMHEGEAFLGMRQMVVSDFASHFLMDFDCVLSSADTLRSSSLIPFIERVCSKFQQPTKGIVISHSCWFSSLEMEMDDDTSEQGEFLRKIGIEFAPMPSRDKQEITEWGVGRGLQVLFDADQVPIRRG